MGRTLAVAALVVLGLSSTVKAEQRLSALAPLTYVSVSTITPPVSGANAFAFQNVSATQDVFINRVDIVSASTGPATGGLMAFYVYGSTAILAGGTSQVAGYAYGAALKGAYVDASTTTAPIVASTGPVNVTYENLYPILPPLFVNNAPAATTLTNVAASYADAVPVTAAILLPAGSKRGLVFQKQKIGSNTDVVDGMVLIRVVYSIR